MKSQQFHKPLGSGEVLSRDGIQKDFLDSICHFGLHAMNFNGDGGRCQPS